MSMWHFVLRTIEITNLNFTQSYEEIVLYFIFPNEEIETSLSNFVKVLSLLPLDLLSHLVKTNDILFQDENIVQRHSGCRASLRSHVCSLVPKYTYIVSSLNFPFLFSVGITLKATAMQGMPAASELIPSTRIYILNRFYCCCFFPFFQNLQ